MTFPSFASLSPFARKTFAGLLAGATLLAASSDAFAQYRRYGGPGYGYRNPGYYNGGGYRQHRGFPGGGLLLGGAVGALALGAIAGSAYGYPRYGYARPAYADEGDCYIQRRRYWDGYGYVIRRVQVCD